MKLITRITQDPKDLALEQGFTESGINHRRWTAKTGKRDFPKNVRVKEQSARALFLHDQA